MNLWIAEHGEYAYQPLRLDADGNDILMSSRRTPLEHHAYAVAQSLGKILQENDIKLDAIVTSQHIPSNYTASVVAAEIWSPERRLDVIQSALIDKAITAHDAARTFFSELGANVLAVYCPKTLANYGENLGLDSSQLPIRFGWFIGPIELEAGE
jgi:hypothetical protein